MDEATEACPRLSARCLFRPSGCPQSALGPGLCSLAEKGNSVGQSWARPLTSGTWVRTQDGRGHSRCQLAWRACSSMRPQDDPGPRMTPGGGLRTAHPWGRSLGGRGSTEPPLPHSRWRARRIRPAWSASSTSMAGPRSASRRRAKACWTSSGPCRSSSSKRATTPSRCTAGERPAGARRPRSPPWALSCPSLTRVHPQTYMNT